MDITGVTQNVQASSEMISAARAANTAPTKRSEVTTEQVKVPAVEQTDFKRMDEKRMGDIKKVIERNSFQDTYAVRDNSFTIFKDKSGQFITRFTDLRTGGVTYVPEPEILKFEGASESYVEVSA